MPLLSYLKGGRPIFFFAPPRLAEHKERMSNAHDTEAATVQGFDAIESALISGSLADAFRIATMLHDAATLENTEATIAKTDGTIPPAKRSA